jgi:hypothetical protein
MPNSLITSSEAQPGNFNPIETMIQLNPGDSFDLIIGVEEGVVFTIDINSANGNVTMLINYDDATKKNELFEFIEDDYWERTAGSNQPILRFSTSATGYDFSLFILTIKEKDTICNDELMGVGLLCLPIVFCIGLIVGIGMA